MSEVKSDNSLQHILVVDDEELIVDLLHDYFDELGYDVCVAQSAEEAIEKLNNEKQFNLVLTDINLPGKSGLDLLKIVRETREDLPVVLLTGLKTLDNAITAVKSGAADYITKPFELDSVRRVVEKILKRQDRTIKKEQVFDNLKYLKLSFQFLTSEMDPSILAKELAGYLQRVNFGENQEINQYELAFTETLVNAVEHGSLDLASSIKSNNILQLAEYDDLKEQRLNDLNFSKRTIFIMFECTDELFSFTVKDQGKGFEWQKYIDKSHKISKVNTNAYGRGFNIIQHIIDEVHFNESGNMITLIKNKIQK
jgi:YesN/AraC family two-component response regulator